MLRFVRAARKHPTKLDALSEDGLRETVVLVEMAAETEYATVTVHLTMKERADDETLLADAKRLALDALTEVQSKHQAGLR